ncbi:tol-pal system protein YbgF [Telluria aromaticivorans]|uniref:Cell division coordinator CpoB n=1 Tax=Telluria aromaticivorans TaxID=2725995 RepID=A0A7Y2JZ57_9BURK|nr:tol-pal system protein YbgF [Telluria aromaticivorans]NNG23685.1 tol-pal system protein YbgF [Telluria aromaticivorans]
MMKLSPSRLACLVLMAWMPLQASAGLLDDDEARKAILDLRTKVDSIARDLNARIDTKSDKTVQLDMLNQHEQTMQEISRLRGQIEVLANEISKAQNSQKQLYADLDARIKKIEPQQEIVDGQAAEVLPSEKTAYESATAMFQSGDYKGAATALQDFVRRYPESPYASNAQYWLGNAYYALGDYKKAIAAQEVVTRTYSDSPKVPDAMLNIASSYALLKDSKNAKKALQQLVSKYPGTSAGKTAKDRLASLK